MHLNCRNFYYTFEAKQQQQKQHQLIIENGWFDKNSLKKCSHDKST